MAKNTFLSSGKQLTWKKFDGETIPGVDYGQKLYTENKKTIRMVSGLIVANLIEQIQTNNAEKFRLVLKQIPIWLMTQKGKHDLVYLVLNSCYDFRNAEIVQLFLLYYSEFSQMWDENNLFANLLAIPWRKDVLFWLWQNRVETFEDIVIALLPMANTTQQLKSLSLIAKKFEKIGGVPREETEVDTFRLLEAVKNTKYKFEHCNVHVVEFIRKYHAERNMTLFPPSWLSENIPETEDSLYGPLNLPLFVPEKKDVVWERSFRMLYYPSSWFVGYCQVCKIGIPTYREAARRPLLACGGWDGCFCSWEHVLDSLVPANDIFTKAAIGYFSNYVDNHKILV